MSQEKFVAGCSGVYFYNGVVLVDFNGFSLHDRDNEGRPLQEVSQRIVMTPKTMLETINAMNSLSERLVKAGVLKLNSPPAPQDGQATEDAEGKGEPAPAPNSPNFT